MCLIWTVQWINMAKLDNWHYKNDNSTLLWAFVTFGLLWILNRPRCHSHPITISQVLGGKTNQGKQTHKFHGHHSLLLLTIKVILQQRPNLHWSTADKEALEQKWKKKEQKLTPSLLVKVHQSLEKPPLMNVNTSVHNKKSLAPSSHPAQQWQQCSIVLFSSKLFVNQSADS